MADQKRVKSITLDRVEGRISDLDVRTVKTFEAASKVLRDWAQTAPAAGEGYDKTDFSIEWEDGETYSGRIDLNSDDPESWDLAGHVRRFASYHAGLWRPPGTTQEDHLEDLRRLERYGGPKRSDWKRLLDEYELT